MLKLGIKRISPEFNDIPLPGYETPGSSGMDIRAAIKQDVVINPGEIKIIPTNLSFQIPEGYELQVRPRSGLAAKYGIGIVNAPGTIDADYRGEVKIILINFGSSDFTITKGDRIAQLILSNVFQAKLDLLEELDDTQRGDGGFGHTGHK